MKKQLQFKTKLLIGVGAGLLATTAVVTPLAITLTQNNNNTDENIDLKYGVDDSTYNTMKVDCVNMYTAALDHEHLTFEEKTLRLNALNRSLSALDSQVKKLMTTTKNVYTTATTALKTIAKQRYGVDLVRRSRANWAEVQTMFSGMQSSFKTYMENHFFSRDKIDLLLNKSNESFRRMISDLKTKYAVDVLGGVLQAKLQLVSCFDSINAEIAKLAASIRLNEFFSNYEINYRLNAESFKGAAQEANRVDLLELEGALENDQPIDAFTMNKVFVCVNKETRQEVPFSYNLLPGYTIKPIYKGLSHDYYQNHHAIKIDWTIVSDNVQEEDKVAATAHLYQNNENTIKLAEQGDVHSIEEAFDDEHLAIAIMEHGVYTSSRDEANQLNNIYFNEASNGASIALTWDQRYGAKPCYDGFMYADQNATSEQILNLRQLADTGIAIKYGNNEFDLLKNVLARLDVEGYEPQNTIEKFVKYCDVQDIIKIEHTANGDNVTNNFRAFYKNESNFDDHYQKSIGSVAFGNTLPANNFKVSDQFFDVVNNTFNMDYTSSFALLDKKYKTMAEDAESAEACNYATLALTLLNIVIATSIVVFLGITQEWSKFFGTLVLLVVEILWCVFVWKKVAILNHTVLVPISDYASQADLFNSGAEAKKVSKKLKEDKEMFVLADSKGKIDKTSPEYIAKRDAFKELQPQRQKEIFELYYYFTVSFAKDFFQEAYDLHIHPKQFYKDFGHWYTPGTDDTWFVNLCYLVIELSIIGVMTALWFSVNGKEDAAELSAAKAVADEEAWTTLDYIFAFCYILSAI